MSCRRLKLFLMPRMEAGVRPAAAAAAAAASGSASGGRSFWPGKLVPMQNAGPDLVLCRKKDVHMGIAVGHR